MMLAGYVLYRQVDFQVELVLALEYISRFLDILRPITAFKSYPRPLIAIHKVRPLNEQDS